MQSFKIEIKSVAIVLIAMIVGAILSFQHGGFAALVIILFSLGGYAFLWLKTGNATHILGLMYLGFVLPMGVANFRLAAYQSLWEMGTWWCFILATAMFSGGFVGGEMIMSRCLKEECRDFLHKENAFSEKAYLWLASILFLLMLSGYGIKYYVAGSLPFFIWTGADDYIRFLSGAGHFVRFQNQWQGGETCLILIKFWHRFSTIFLFQGWLVSCVSCHYLRRNWDRVNCLVKAVMLLMVIICMGLPVLIVCREIFVMTTVSLAVYLYVTNRCHWHGLVSGIVLAAVTVCGFALTSQARGYTARELANVFEMKLSITDSNALGMRNESARNLEYPAHVVWAYTYFTGGYDSFNHLRKTIDFQTNGLMQLRPIFSALQINDLKDIDEKIQKPKYRVSPNITIYTFLSDAFVDFREVGIALSMLFWGVLFGMVAYMATCRNSKLFLFVYAALGHHTIFMCFVPWMGHFSYMCSFGILWIFYLVCSGVCKYQQQSVIKA